ncbi:ropporin-1-like protein [Harpegnathos saltator]|uniref:ropporin-1-like protein n=1 Tax=Harpegnathos saltator TaxID=610380 RepID=UPI000DBEEBA0|nr:ropporin-1-like protein [Harpegnathos saltator]
MPYVEQLPLSGKDIVVLTKLPMILKQFYILKNSGSTFSVYFEKPILPSLLRYKRNKMWYKQPYDLLKWSSSYFRTLADSVEPPAKSRLEYLPPSTAKYRLRSDSGLPQGTVATLEVDIALGRSSIDEEEQEERKAAFLKNLKFANNIPTYSLLLVADYNITLSLEAIARCWDCLCLNRRDFQTITTIDQFRRNCQMKRFLAIAVGLIAGNLTETMIMVCQLFNHEPDGGSAIPLSLLIQIYEYLARLVCDGNEKSSCDEETSTRKDSSIHHTSSVNSQDTDADVNLESMSKDEVDSYSKRLVLKD